MLLELCHRTVETATIEIIKRMWKTISEGNLIYAINTVTYLA